MKKLILMTLLSTTLLFTGTFVMKKGESLKKADISIVSATPTLPSHPSNTNNNNNSNTDSYKYEISTPLIYLPYSEVHGFNGWDSKSGRRLILSGDNQTFEFKNKVWDGESAKGAIINVQGTVGANQTVIIKASKFTNMSTTAIRINKVDNIIIEGNYFQGVATPLRIYNFKNLSIKYNKIKNHGLTLAKTPWAKNGTQAHLMTINDSRSIETLDVSYNLVDRSSDPRYNPNDTIEQRHAKAHASDYMNFRNLNMIDGARGVISYNILVGSEKVGEAALGGAFIADHNTYKLDFHNNIAFNATGTSYTSANSGDLSFTNNIGYHTPQASGNLLRISYSPLSHGTLKNETYGVRFEQYGGHGLTPNLGEHTITGNRIIAHREDGVNVHYIGARVESKIISDTFMNMSNNSFDWKKDSNNNKLIVEQLSRGSILYKHYPSSNGALPDLTANEISQLVFGINYGGNTDNKMFSKWGTAKNSPKYFDESRTLE